MFRATVSPLVVGVPGACYCKFNSRALAEAAFEDAQVTGGVCIVYLIPRLTDYPSGGINGSTGRCFPHTLFT